MSRLNWYLRRLRAMSGPEIIWRAGRLRYRALNRPITWAAARSSIFGRVEPDWAGLLERFRDGTDRPVLLDRARAESLAVQCPDEVAAVVAAAEQVLAGKVRYFGYPLVGVGASIDWNFDAQSGIRWPSVNSERIDHRTAAGDPKWIWELNRLQHLPWLAQAWLFTGEDRFADAAFEHLDGWIEQQPPGTGIAWRGAFECGLRAISVAIAVQGLRTAPGLTAERYARIVTLLAESARRCWAERSLFSSANNHLIGELTGLAVVAILVPDLPDAVRWERDALAALAEHADRQILADGAGAEQAVAYQLFTVELLGIVYGLLALRGTPPPRLGAAITRSARYLALLVGDTDPQPRFGDDDGGFALRLGPEEVRTVREHLGIVNALLPDPAAARAATDTVTAAWWRAALGTASTAADSESGVASEVPGSGYAADGGLVVLRSRGRRITMDVGPLGYLSIAAHGHADALAVTLAADGVELIGDPGTASYYGHPEWRAAHRSTRAHATVTVDGMDQSVVAGPFMWSAHAGVRVRAVDIERGVVDAEHDGYRRLAEPVVHRRWLIAPPDRDAVAVVDLLSGTGIHTADVSWPLHPALEVSEVDGGQVAVVDGNPLLALAYAATVPLDTARVRGDEQTNLGWWSERLESREPSWLIGARCGGAGPFAVVTVLSLDAEPVRDLRIGLSGEEIRANWTEAGGRHTLTIDTSRDGSAELSSDR
ncbi:alginate lyase family protein [Nocardia sp. CDC153]|uniref:heparinase II/III family protein n=1 Tax=Nocardia sp. CDC153 TaxID=3112167 RepID=UPI002DBC13F6|nr:alginate lyase family protein [Nocardia sp. CDC153]MEC3955857.1 alginate lyase family protein [Nocardia sp. CDC153]